MVQRNGYRSLSLTPRSFLLSLSPSLSLSCARSLSMLSYARSLSFSLDTLDTYSLAKRPHHLAQRLHDQSLLDAVKCGMMECR